MNLQELLRQLEQGGSQGTVKVCADSRKVGPGDVFVAVQGTNVDGHEFVGQAVKQGAGVIVASRPVDAGAAKVVIVPDSGTVLGAICQASRGWPARKLTCLAVTGTKGKTTTTYLARSVIQAAGKKSGLIGTVTYDTGAGAIQQSSMTTPDAVAMAEMTGQMVANGAEYLVVEASSHALDQGRLGGIEFRAAAFTNLTGDHMDYHKTKDAYMAAKAKLFAGLGADATAVLNRKSPESEFMAKSTKARVLWYAADEEADIEAKVLRADSSCTEYDLCFEGEKVRVRTPMIGMYNMSNHLAAAGMCIGAGFELETIAAGLSGLAHVPGRLEAVDCGQAFRVLVDYAHTDDAMKNVMATLGPICRGRLIIVFGCGGDRDKTKRPRMARVAQEMADVVYVTSDNPRTEEPEAIIKDIMTGFSEPAMKRVVVEADRKKAIELALAEAKDADVVLIAGKGHEDYQIIGTTKHHFSDREVVEEWFASR